MCDTTLLHMTSQSLTNHEHNYHSTKQEFLALKWAIAEQFQEYLQWKPFVVKTNNIPLTYILTTPNLDVIQHHWVESLARFTFSIKYQKGRDNAVVDALSHVTSKLNAEALKSILDRVTIGTTGRADAHDLMVAEANKRVHKQVEETTVQAQAAHTCVNLYVMDWVAVQQEDPILKIVMEWISFHKLQDLKHLLGDQHCDRRGHGHPKEEEEIHAPSGLPLSLPYSDQRAGRSSAVCSPHGS